MNNFQFISSYFTNRAYGYKMCDQKKISWIQLSHLSSNHEEADTKVFLAAKFAENVGCSDITVFAVDSDGTTVAAFNVRMINFCLMVHIGIGSNVGILDIGTESLPALPTTCYFRLRFCKRC